MEPHRHIHHLKPAWSLLGETLLAFEGEEMAMVEWGPAGRPVFQLPQTPFRQFNRFFILTRSGARYQLFTEGDGEDGLGAKLCYDAPEQRERPPDENSIFRFWRRELPACVIRQLRIGLDSEDRVMDLTLVSDDFAWLLLPGEVVEDAQPSFRWPDESILLFDDPAQVEAVNWANRPRTIHFTIEQAR